MDQAIDTRSTIKRIIFLLIAALIFFLNFIVPEGSYTNASKTLLPSPKVFTVMK